MRTQDRAVVIGASMAGLLAARVLADHFGQVVLLDRDTLPEVRGNRRGVPQGRHVHGVLPGGQHALETLFPGLTGQLQAEGVAKADILANVRWCLDGAPLRQTRIGLPGLPVSRPFLEGAVRERVRALQAVEIVDGCEVSDLVTTSDRRRVTGVRLHRRGHAEAEELAADLVVDASGRGSRTPHWLAGLGYPEPVKEEVKVGITYVTRPYRLRPGALADDVFILVAPTTAVPRFGALTLQEDGSFLVTIGGLFGQAPASTDRAFTDFAATLPAPDLAEALAGGEPLADFARFRFPASVRRRYDRLRSFPDGLIVIGDAIASFNPIYGQGMSVAALEAVALANCLRRGSASGLSRRFFRAAHRVEDVAWKMAVGGDLQHPAVPGRRTADVRLVNAYLARLRPAAHGDARLSEAFVRVAGFADPPSALFRPRTVVRVLAGSGRVAPDSHRGAGAPLSHELSRPH